MPERSADTVSKGLYAIYREATGSADRRVRQLVSTGSAISAQAQAGAQLLISTHSAASHPATEATNAIAAG